MLSLHAHTSFVLLLMAHVASGYPAPASADEKDIVRDRQLEKQFEAGKKWAIVIGVNEYVDPTIPNLRFGVADAHLVADTLQKNCGYEEQRILRMTDDQPKRHLQPLRTNMHIQVAEWLKKARPGDTIFVYFSGHGFLDDRGQKFLALGDCQRNALGLSSIRADELRDMLHQCSATQKLLVLDCCHAGGQKGDQPGPSSEEIGASFADAEGLITLASCGRDEFSYEWDEKGHGLFTWHLAQGLSGSADRDDDGVVDSDEIYSYVYRHVTASTLNVRQTPVRLIGEDVRGRFAIARPFRAPVVKTATLSETSISLLANLQPTRKVRVEFYHTEDLPDGYQQVRRDIDSLFNELSELPISEHLETRIRSVALNSQLAEVAKQRFGIEPVAVPTADAGEATEVILGMAVMAGPETIVVPFLGRGLSAEHEMIRALNGIVRNERKQLGLIQTAARAEGGFNQNTGRFTPAWHLVEELMRQYNMHVVDAHAEIDAKFDVLLAIQPSSLTPAELDNLVAAVKRGVPTLILEDPCPLLFGFQFPGTSDPNLHRPPFAQPAVAQKGDIESLWKLLGVEFAKDQLVWQSYNPYPENSQFGDIREFLFIDVGCGEDVLRQDHQVTKGLAQLFFATAGSIEVAERAKHTFEPLVQTGTLTGTISYDEAFPRQPLGNRQLNEQRRFKITREIYCLAAHIHSDEPLEESGRPLNTILITDVDLVAPSIFELRLVGTGGETRNPFDFDNVSFVLNAVDVLAGVPDLVPLRRRAEEHTSQTRSRQELAAQQQLNLKRLAIEAEFAELEENTIRELEKQANAHLDRIRTEQLPEKAERIRTALVQAVLERQLAETRDSLSRQRDRQLRELVSSPARTQRDEDPDSIRGQVFLPAASDILAATEVKITDYDGENASVRQLLLVKEDGQWQLASHYGFPLEDSRRFANALGSLVNLRLLDLESISDRSELADYSLVDPESQESEPGKVRGTKVEVYVEDRPIVSVILGRELVDRAELIYARRTGELTIATVPLDRRLFTTEFLDWVDDRLLDFNVLDRSYFRLIRYATNQRALSIDRRTELRIETDLVETEATATRYEDGEATPLSLRDSQSNGQLIRAFMSAPTRVGFRRVVPLPNPLQGKPQGDSPDLAVAGEMGFLPLNASTGLDWAGVGGELVVQLRTGVRYHLKFGDKVGADTADADLRTTILRAEIDDKILEKYLAGESPREREDLRKQIHQHVREFNQRSQFMFFISNDDFRDLCPGMSDLVKDQ